MKLFLALILIFTGFYSSGQETNTMDSKSDPLPYHQIPDYPDTYTSGNIVGRMIDGLGYRYYWATEGLTENELNYKPGEDSRTILETMNHILGLSRTVKNAALAQPNSRPVGASPTEYAEIRKVTLQNIKEASDLFKMIKGDDIEQAKVIFQRGENTNEFPLWNLLNGMLADAIYHTGQVTAFRRAAGNPINPFVSVFNGKTGSGN